MTISTRRAFVRGQWQTSHPDTTGTAGNAEIVSLIVNTWPERLEEVETSVLGLAGTEVHGRDPKGKLIVVIEAATVGMVGDIANTISGLPHVLSAAMVFQATDLESA